MKNILFCALLIASLSSAKTGLGQTGTLSADTAAINFITNATISNEKEISTGKLAQQKGKDKRVKNFGLMMVKDHAAASKELEGILKGKNFTPPNPTVPNDSNVDALKTARGLKFDELYITTMLIEHMNTIALFERADKNVQDPEIKAFVAKTLPKIKMHFTHARNLATKLNVNTKGIVR